MDSTQLSDLQQSSDTVVRLIMHPTVTDEAISQPSTISILDSHDDGELPAARMRPKEPS
jgi:hypothetical protein